jgi:Helicase conserved C-terminal domain
MQMYAHEGWDLLMLLGLSGRWAKSAEAFEGYFRNLRLPLEERNLRQMQVMLTDYFSDKRARRDTALEKALKHHLGLVKSPVITTLHQQPYSRDALVGLHGEARQALDRWLREHTPMRDRAFRTTRSTLKRYRDEGRPGFEHLVIPERHVNDCFVAMTDRERLLYRRVEDYISRHYNRYLEEQRKALGFIMTVYRRRLTSSFAAIERSLRRRQEALRAGHLTDLLDEDDIAALETSALVDVGELSIAGCELVDELREVEEFLSLLKDRPPDETKMRQLGDDLRDAFMFGHQSVLVFTQYTDTMDYLRDRLVGTYGEAVGTYSGRGGEVYRNGEWCPVDRSTIRRSFRQVDGGLRILIGTDALSEGFNLQTCARLINYDMPWNFMRVEQRIGRVDRIEGQPDIFVSNYFYRDTVEETIYTGISEDFDWFTDIVGPAQAVLGQVEELNEAAALAQTEEARAAGAEEAADRIRAGIAEARELPVSVETMVGDLDEPDIPPPALTLDDLRRLLTNAADTAGRFRAHETIDDAWWLTLHDRCVAVTFTPGISDQHDIPLLSYFTAEFDELLQEALGPAADPVLACTRITPPFTAAEPQPTVEQHDLLSPEQTLLT